ncbi:MAG: hypothetical protein IPK83_23020 [Planctomycetes bacterium]|nr:hypothetical protein [Planctomycetota bacterium]
MKLIRMSFIAITLTLFHSAPGIGAEHSNDAPMKSSLPGLFAIASDSNEHDRIMHQRPDLLNFAKRSRLTFFSSEVLSAAAVDGPRQVQLSLFDDVSLLATIDRVFEAPIGDLRVAGTIEGVDGSCVVIVIHEGVLAANITVPGIGFFDIKPIDAGRVIIREIDLVAKEAMGCGAIDQPPTMPGNSVGHRALGDDVTPDEDNAGDQRGGQSSICPLQFSTLAGFVADDGSQIDLMFYYTAAAQTAAGGQANIEAELDLSVTYTNNAYVNSGINTSLNVVRKALINYTESTSAIVNLDRLVLTADGFLDLVHAERDQYGADLVCLCVGNTVNSGGVAYQLFETSPLDDGRYGFSVMREDNATFETLAHEVGHNFGCQHDRCNPQGTPYFDYGWGFRQPCPGPPPTPCSSPWPCTPNKDIMSYPPGMTVPYFSNPGILVGGSPIGGTDEHGGWCDNSSAHNGTAFTVANFRPSVVTPTPPSRVYVNSAAAPGGDGATWATALDDLQDGIGLAARARGAVTEVWVAAGDYYPDRGTGNRYASFRLINGVTIYGGFFGNETLLAHRNVSANPTILSGDIGTPVEATDNSYHVVIASDRNSTAILDGVTIRDGHASGPYWPLYAGGGMLSQCTDSQLIQCTISNNFATFIGGGIYSDEAPQQFQGCLFSGNIAPYGGGIEIYNSSPDFINTEFQANLAEFVGGGANCNGSQSQFTGCEFLANGTFDEFGYHGAIRSGSGSSIVVEDCSFTGNSAYAVGAIGIDSDSTATIRDSEFIMNFADYSGAVEVYENHADIENCWFFGNTSAETVGIGQGGALTVLNNDSSATVRDCRFESNEAGFGGGAIAKFDQASLDVSNTTFIYNYAWYGGGIWCDKGESTFSNCKFFANSAEYGGGAAHFSGMSAPGPSPHNIANCVFTGNEALDGWGGAFFNAGETNVAIDHCTIANNSALTGEGGGIHNDTSITALTHSIVWGNLAFFGDNETAQLVSFGDVTYLVSYCDVLNWSGSLGGIGNFPMTLDDRCERPGQRPRLRRRRRACCRRIALH